MHDICDICQEWCSRYTTWSRLISSYKRKWKLISMGTVRVCTPTSNGKLFPLLYILTSTSCHSCYYKIFVYIVKYAVSLILSLSFLYKRAPDILELILYSWGIYQLEGGSWVKCWWSLLDTNPLTCLYPLDNFQLSHCVS